MFAGRGEHLGGAVLVELGRQSSGQLDPFGREQLREHGFPGQGVAPGERVVVDFVDAEQVGVDGLARGRRLWVELVRAGDGGLVDEAPGLGAERAEAVVDEGGERGRHVRAALQ